MPSPSSIDVVTFGCRLNAAESDRMRVLAGEAGLDDVAIVNTCAVTAEAERQARQAIRRIRRERPDARIVVTGCGAQIDSAAYAALPEADFVLGNAEKLRPDTWRTLREGGRRRVGDIMAVPPPAAVVAGAPLTGEGRTRAFVEAQQGCDHRCTFCVIPYGRGPSRSLPAAEVTARLRALAAAGTREVVLTGVDLASWGRDLPGAPRLAGLLRAILEDVPALPRLRLSSLDPAAVDTDLVALFAEERRLMPHVHLSLQAGDDLILKRMKRRHARAQALAAIAALRAARPGMAFGADLIAGFPTETDAQFANTKALIDEAGLDLVHVFPYSPRPGTPAARMPQLDAATIQARAAGLRAAAAAAQARFLARQVGRTVTVLVERGGRRGHAEDFAPVSLSRPLTPGSLVDAAIAGVSGDALLAHATGKDAA